MATSVLLALSVAPAAAQELPGEILAVRRTRLNSLLWLSAHSGSDSVLIVYDGRTDNPVATWIRHVGDERIVLWSAALHVFSALVDMDSDGVLDLLLWGSNEYMDQWFIVLLARDSGVQEVLRISRDACGSVRVADVDRDGNPDIVVPVPVLLDSYDCSIQGPTDGCRFDGVDWSTPLFWNSERQRYEPSAAGSEEHYRWLATRFSATADSVEAVLAIPADRRMGEIGSSTLGARCNEQLVIGLRGLSRLARSLADGVP